jgi:hypothetical protein
MNKPECKIYPDGTKFWFLNGKYHREDGPAVEYTDGHKSWYLNGKRHREDGPAIEYKDGTKRWYLNGNFTAKMVRLLNIQTKDGDQTKMVVRLNVNFTRRWSGCWYDEKIA